MATQTRWEEIPNVEEQTPLDEPIKIRWSGHDRKRVRRGLVAFYESGDIERGVAVPVMLRQKSQIVIKTEEELEGFRSELDYKAKWRVRKRIENEIEKQLNGEDDEEPERSEAHQRRKEETDLDVLMEEIIIPHARKKAKEVWPGGTVDVDEITWFWSNRYSWAAGYAYHGAAIPQDVNVEGKRLAIGLSPHYYYQHGLDSLLGIVRHELIHIWQYEHPDAPKGHGHGRGFKQWLDDMDTHRHCKHYSK